MRNTMCRFMLRMVIASVIGIAALAVDNAYADPSQYAQITLQAVTSVGAEKIGYADTSNNDPDHDIQIKSYNSFIGAPNLIEVWTGTNLLAPSDYSIYSEVDQGTMPLMTITIRAGVLQPGTHHIQVKQFGVPYFNVVQTIVSNNARLSSLSVGSGNLNEIFDSGRTSYTQSVNENVNTINVTPVSSDSLAVLSIQANNGEYTPAISGQASNAIALSYGVNIIRIRVTAPNGINKTYEISVTRSSTIAQSAITGVTVPKAGEVPQTTIPSSIEYTAAIAWSPADAKFRENTVYSATITLTPKPGFRLNGVPSGFFKVAGAASANATGSGVVQAVFPVTGANPNKPILSSNIQVKAPVTGATRHAPKEHYR